MRKPPKKRNLVLRPTVDGTLEEVLASMTVQESHANPNNITWDFLPDTYFHVVIQDEQGKWLLQTHTTGSFGFYIGGYIVNQDPNDGNINIVKGEQYYLHFRNQNVTVPFIVDGKI